MGNRPDRDKHTSPTRPMEDPEGGGGVAVDPAPPKRTWIFDLEDLTVAAQGLLPQVAVRVRQTEPRIQVHAGDPLVGYAPADVSAEIRSALGAMGGSLLGHVLRVDLSAGRVEVELSLEGQ
jgi:hypothetical protein